MARLTVDEIVTLYKMDASDYLAKAGMVEASTKSLIKSHDILDNATRLSGRGFSALGVAAAGTGLSIGGLAYGLVSLVVESGKAAASFDTLQRSLAAVTGSGARAKEILKFVDALAIPSVFDSKALADGALTLEAFQLRAERFLPVAEKLGTVFGGTSEALQSFVSALGYIKGERFGEGFESLSRAGISKKDLSGKYGLTFDKGGSYTGDVNKALDAIEKIVNDRFGKVAEQMASGPAAKFASLMDNLSRMLRQFGTTALEFALPVIDSMGTKLTNLVASGAIERIGAGMFKMFGGSSGFADGITKAISYLLALFETGPSLMKGLIASFDTMRKSLQFSVSFMTSLFIAGPLINGIKTVIGLVRTMAFTWAAGATAAEAFAMATGVGIPQALAAAAGAAAFALGLTFAMNKMMDSAGASLPDAPGMKAFLTAQDRILADMNKKNPDGSPATTLETPSVGSGLATTPVPVLQKIEENTRPLRELANQILGGGSYAKVALNRQDLSDLRSGRSSGGGGGGANHYEDMVLRGMRGMALVQAIQMAGGNGREL